jgi:hypothetical protein
MTTSVNYATPILVNGFQCKNCTDVDYAKKHIDPAHPKDGPYGIDARTAGKPVAGSTGAPAANAATLARSSIPGVGGLVDVTV